MNVLFHLVAGKRKGRLSFHIAVAQQYRVDYNMLFVANNQITLD